MQVDGLQVLLNGDISLATADPVVRADRFAAQACAWGIEERVEIHSHFQDNAGLLARHPVFHVCGVPQVCQVGLLTGQNDMALRQMSGVGRDINRHHFSPADIDHAMG